MHPPNAASALPTLDPDTAQTLASLPSGSHACLIYDDPQEQLAIASAFVSSGLARGQRCLYLADDRSVEEVANALTEAGVDVVRQTSRGALTLARGDAWLKSGAFDPHATMVLVRSAADDASAAGFAGLCVTSEMTWALGGARGCGPLTDHETLLDGAIAPASGVVSLCQYNRRRMPPDVVRRALRAHPIAIVRGQVLDRSLFYEPADAMGPIGAALDGTEPKLAEQTLASLNAQLEARVEARTAELQAANKELEAFSYSVSHDLRAPLRALQGFSRILLEEYLQQLPADAQRYLALIRDNAAQMGQLIDDLLTFSRLGRQGLDRHVVHLAPLVDAALEQLAPERSGRNVQITVAEMPPCLGDPTLLRQVLANLLANALKFTRRRDPAVVEVGAAREPARPGERVYFVRDNGVGFDMRYADKLFGIFQRLHSATEYEGTGVGLAIVQRIVHRHGGRVWADAAVDRGATFYFALPGGRADV